MDTIGYQLRAARARKNCTLEAASGATKIKVELLEALEADNFARFPSPIYTKSFLKTYADFLGLDGHAVAEQFAREHHLRPQLPLVQPPAESAAAAPEGWDLRPNLIYGALAAVLALLFGAIFWAREKQQRAAPSPPPAAVAPAPAASTGKIRRELFAPAHFDSETVALPASVVPDKHLLSIKAHRPVMLRVLADNRKEFDGILAAGERREFLGRAFTVAVAHAGAVTAWLDGQRLPPLGKADESVEQQLPPSVRGGGR